MKAGKALQTTLTLKALPKASIDADIYLTYINELFSRLKWCTIPSF